MKVKPKRLLSMLLTLCMVLTLIPAMTLPVRADGTGEYSVSLQVNGTTVSLTDQYPLLNKDGSRPSTGTLDGETIIAHLDTGTGTLTLWNYVGGSITNGGTGSNMDITVVLKGNNTITDGSLNDATGGDITITAESDATLKITKTVTTGSITGISTKTSGVNSDPGAITIGGKAKVIIDVENTGTGKARGIYAKQGVTINDGAELSITAKSTGANSGENTYGIFTEKESITINTTGDVTVDTSGAGEGSYSYALRSVSFKITLAKVGTMELKWTEGAGQGGAYNGTPDYDTGNFIVTYPDSTTMAYTYDSLPVTLIPGDGKITLSAYPAQNVLSYYYKTSSTSESAPNFIEEKKVFPATTGYKLLSSDTEITGPNGTEIFVQVVKATGSNGTIYSFGEASATPTGGGGGGEPIAVTGVSLNKDTLALVVSDSEKLTATVTPEGATNKAVTWSSNNESVATVDENGKVKAVAAGTALITAKTTDGNHTDTCTVTVYETIPVPTGLVWDGTTAKWNAVEGATSYAVRLMCHSDPGQATHNMTQAGWISVTDTSTELDLKDHLHPGMTYAFNVRALINSEQGNMSSISEKRTMDGSLGTISVAWGSGDDKYKASWDAVDNAEGYVIWVLKNGSQVNPGARSQTDTSIDITNDINSQGAATYTLNVYAGTDSNYSNYLAYGESPELVVKAETPDIYTVTVTNDGNGTAGADKATANVGDTITLTATPNSGYKFKEWQVISGGVTVTDNKFTMPAGDVEVKAVFEEDGGGGTPTAIAVPTANTGLVYTGSEHTGVDGGTGYTLSGTVAAIIAGDYTATATLEDGYKWSDDSTAPKTIDWSIAKAPVALKPILTATAPTSKGANDGEIESNVAGIEYSKSGENSWTTVEHPNQKITGLLAGPYDVRCFGTNNYHPGPIATITVPCTITFDPQGGSETPGDATTGTDGKLASLPSAGTKDGHTFKGWFTAATDGTAVDTDTVFTADTTIYAQWTEDTPITKTVSVGGQNGTLTTGTAGDVTYTVTTENIADGSYPATLNGAPEGVTVSGEVAISSDSGTLTVSTTTATPTGTHPLTLTIDGTTSESFNLVVGSAATAPSITTASLPGGTTGAAYNQTLAANGTAPITWSIIGSLPADLELATDTGTISGTPTATGTFTFTVKATNAAGNDTKELTIEITAAATAPSITTTTLSGGTVGAAYNQTLAANGTAPITWSIIGSLPAGLELATDTGSISGTPTATGTFTFTVKATNAAGDNTRELTIEITAAATAPSITTTTLPGGTTGAAYNQTLAANGTAPITWGIESGALPAGLELATDTGTISGTPTATGTFTFTVKATNAAGSDTKGLTIEITDSAPTVTDVSVTPASTDVQKGTTETFTATVTYSDGSDDNEVDWSVSGKNSSNTKIDSYGELTVGADETAATLTVKATAKQDSSKADTAIVTVTDAPVTKYEVTVIGSYAEDSGEDDYPEGADVKIRAGNRSGYTFSGWTSDDVSIINPANKTTIFKMPAHKVSVTANWSYDGGGTVVEPPYVFAQGTAGTHTVRATNGLIPDIVIAKSQGAKVMELDITAQLPEGAETDVLTVAIPEHIVKYLGNLDVVLQTPFGELGLPAELTAALAASGEGIAITMQAGNSDDVAEQLGENDEMLSEPVDIVTNLRGNIQVTLDCNVTLPEDPEEQAAFLANLYVLAIHASDDVEQLGELEFSIDAETNTLTAISFRVDRFSTFALAAFGQEQPQPEIPQRLVTLIDGKDYVIDGVNKYFEQLTAYRTGESVTVMAVRLLEELGAQIGYKRVDNVGVVTVIYGDITATLREQATEMTVVTSEGARQVTLRTVFTNRDGRTYLPTRDVAENLGFFVQWKASDDSITVTN